MNTGMRAFECYKVLADKYKFYLALENSNCDHYVSEKAGTG